MNAIDPNNPIVLFGDAGPDVFKLSQIYDPDSDEYALSRDELAVAGKTYYTRSYANKTVTFTKVTGVEIGVSTPEANRWYELNPGGEKSTGKYVPAEKSLVIVDFMTDDYDERTILIVESVNETTLKSTLVPHNCGAEGATTARTLKYGNGDYQLYFEHTLIDGKDRVILMPDRKLLLFGSRYYMYRLVSKKTSYSEDPDAELRDVVISVPTAQHLALEHVDNGFAPYLSPSAALFQLSADPAKDNYYANFAGREFCQINGVKFACITIPPKPEQGDSDAYIPSLHAEYKSGVAYFVRIPESYFQTTDASYQPGKCYYVATGVGGTTSYRLIDPATYEVGDVIPSEAVLYEKVNSSYKRMMECVYALTTDTSFVSGVNYYTVDGKGRYVKYTGVRSGSPKAKGLYRQTTTGITGGWWYTAGTEMGWAVNADESENYVEVDVHQTAQAVFGDEPNGWLLTPGVDDKNIFYPGACYLKEGFSIQAGELVNMEVYELCENSDSIRLVMNVTLSTREGNVLTGAQAKTKRITKFVVLNNPAISEGGDSDTWKMAQNDTVSVITKDMKPTITYDDGSTRVLELDDPGLFIYGLEAINTTANEQVLNIGLEFPLLFKYFPGKSKYDTNTSYLNSNYSKGFLSCKKTVAVRNSATATIRKISVIPVGNPSGEYEFRFLTYTTSFASPAIVDYLGTAVHSSDNGVGSEINNELLQFDNTSYLDEGNVERFIQSTSSYGSELFGYILHSVLGLYAKAEGYVNAIYSQNLSLQLQNWTRAAVPVKWLIGDDLTSYDPQLLPYGNPSAGIRPYIEFHADTYNSDPENSEPFQIGSKFNGGDIEAASAEKSPDAFLQSFYYNANPPQVAVEGSSSIAITPNYFIVRSLQTRDEYTRLSDPSVEDEKPQEGIVYLNPTTHDVVVVDEDTNVKNLDIRYTGDVDFYLKDPVTEKMIKADLAVGDTLYANVDLTPKKIDYYTKKTLEINSGYLPITETNASDFNVAPWMERFRLYKVGKVTDSDEVDGGIAYRFGGAIPDVINGNTMVMGTVIVEFVYRDSATNTYNHLYGVPVEVRFPYIITSDTTFEADKTYFVWDEQNKRFTQYTDYTVGDVMKPAIWEQY